jgi:hypothetical protein
MTDLLRTEELAWVVLRAANRVQARGTTVRLVVPRAPEVSYELGANLGEDRLLSAEKHLLERGYIVPVDVGLTRGSYTITPTGFRWLQRGPFVP